MLISTVTETATSVLRNTRQDESVTPPIIGPCVTVWEKDEKVIAEKIIMAIYFMSMLFGSREFENKKGENHMPVLQVKVGTKIRIDQG